MSEENSPNNITSSATTSPTDGDRGFIYHVGSTEFFVSSRPKRLDHSAPNLGGYNPDAYLGVTDTFCSAPPDKIFVWFPWNESRAPIPEMYYACNRALIWWVHYLKLPKVQLFCDGGSHRSVTVFGAFLLTYFPSEAKNIVASRISVGREAAEEGQSDPVGYIETYLRDFPEDRLLFKAMGGDYLSRLDWLSDNICEGVKMRYGKKER